MSLIPYAEVRHRSRSRVISVAVVVLTLVAAFLATTALGQTGVPAASAATCGTTNLAVNHPATASSTENAGTPASAAADGNLGTRWSSAFSDPQWLQVDLGTSQPICQVVLNWEAAYATAFQIQTSPDGTTWTSIFSTTTGTGGVQTLNVSGTGRYVRMYGTARATPYGYSLWEFSVFTTGGGGGNTVTVTNPGSQVSTVGSAASVQISANHAGASATSV